VEVGRDFASRGNLVVDIAADSGLYRDPTLQQIGAFKPFYAVAITSAGMSLLSSGPPSRERMESGVHVLSNTRRDRPLPKTEKLATAIRKELVAADDLVDNLMAALADESSEDGQTNSGIFVRDPRYGTRCSTVITIDADGKGLVVERRFDAAGNVSGNTAIKFNW
jgi:uncharacterized protein with NRDE domain